LLDDHTGAALNATPAIFPESAMFTSLFASVDRSAGIRGRDGALSLFVAVFALVGSIATQAQGRVDQYFIEEWADESRTTSIARPVSAAEFFGVDTAAVSTNYDNWTSPRFGGRTEVMPPIRIGGAEIGDDLLLQGNTGGQLTASGESIFNFNRTENITAFSRRLRWYSSEGSLLSEYQSRVVIVGGALFANTGALTRQSDGFWDFLNLSFPNQIFASVQYSEPDAATVDDFGVYLAGPTTVSTSTSLYRNFTTGQNLDTGSANVNLSWYIRTQVIPTPASGVVAVALSCLISLRRTRTVG
jgi:hypothetical protein